MKNRDLKTLIRRTAERERPEVIDRIDLSTIEIIPPVRKPARTWRWETVVQFAVVTLFVGFTSLFVYDMLTPGPGSDPIALETEAELVGFPIVSAASFLGSFESTDLSLVPLAMTLDMEEPLILDQLDGLTSYLGIMESLLGPADDLGFTAVASDREEYQYRLSYASLDLLGNAITYDIYYNQTPSSEFSDRTEIVGLLVKGTREFSLSGQMIQTSGGIKTRFQAVNDAGDYIVVEDKSTKQMQKFDYSLYQNDALVQSHSVRLMVDSDQVTAMVEYADTQNQISFRFHKEAGTEVGDRIRIRYSFRNLEGNVERETGDITVDVGQNPQTQAYEYRYSVHCQHGNQSSNHETTGKRKDLASETPGNDKPGNDHPGPDHHGPDNPGFQKPSPEKPGSEGHGSSGKGNSRGERLLAIPNDEVLFSL